MTNMPCKKNIIVCVGRIIALSHSLTLTLTLSLSLSLRPKTNANTLSCHVVHGCIPTNYDIMPSIMSNKNNRLLARRLTLPLDVYVCFDLSLSIFTLFKKGAWWCGRRVCSPVTCRCRQVKGNDQFVKTPGCVNMR